MNIIRVGFENGENERYIQDQFNMKETFFWFGLVLFKDYSERVHEFLPHQ